MRQEFKIGDAVKIKKNSASATVFSSTALLKAKRQENKIGKIISDTGTKNWFCVYIEDELDSFWWNPEHLELVDVPREQMLEIESVL